MKFEEMMHKQRAGFDNIENVPKDLIWHGIQDNLRRRNTRRIYIRLSMAASVIVLVGAFAVFSLNNTNRKNNELAFTPEFSEEENKYYQLANNKMSEINYEDLDKDEYGEIMSELEELDSMYFELKSEIATIPNAEKAIQTAIKFHERRLHILELLEKEIENRKKEEINESNIKI